jgi:hypothetical protein
MAKRQPMLSEALHNALNEYLESLRQRIVERAAEIADLPQVSTADDSQDQSRIEIDHLAKAIEEVAPGPSGSKNSSIGLSGRLSHALSSFTGVSAILAILFAVLGLCALLVPRASELKGQSQAFLDVAKIFAGAVVGSAGATVVTRGRKRLQ